MTTTKIHQNEHILNFSVLNFCAILLNYFSLKRIDDITLSLSYLRVL